LPLRDYRARNGMMERLTVGNRKLRMTAAQAPDNRDVVHDDTSKTAQLVSLFGSGEAAQLARSATGAPHHVSNVTLEN
jgi:hypothetical protein